MKPPPIIDGVCRPAISAASIGPNPPNATYKQESPESIRDEQVVQPLASYETMLAEWKAEHRAALRMGEQALACGPDGGGWFKRSGSLWQRTLFDLATQLATTSPATAQPDLDRITSG